MASQPQGRAKPKAPKAKLLQGLRNTHTEQLAKLQQKYQFEQDLLEDVRAYCKQRSAIEKEYSQNLQKLSANYLQKRVSSSPSDTDDNHHRFPEAVWKNILEESDNYSKKRMEISDRLQTQVVEEIKAFKANKAQVFKKCQDFTQKIQEEVFDTIREMSKSKKLYIEAEKLAQVAGEQAAEAEDKFKKKNTKFFQSKATLEKNVSKSSSRKEFSEVKATGARNEYLLNLAAANAHMTRYYCTDLQQILETVYGTFYETIRDYFLNIGKLEASAATHAKNGFENLLSEARLIERDYCIQDFLQKCPVFTRVLNYEFEPCRKDKISKLNIEGNPGVSLNKEARKLAMRLVREQKTIKEKQRILSGLKSSSPNEVSGTGEPTQDPELNPENIKEQIRHAELIKLKSEASLDLMRDAGVNVEEWLKSANALSVTSKELSSSQTSLDSASVAETTDWNDDDEEWDIDDTFVGDSESDEDANSLASSGSLPIPCVALYNFESSNTDELTIVENEELEVLEKDGDGWCKGRNKKGEIGYFPESYVEFKRKKRPSLTSNHSGSIHSGSYTDSSLGTSPARTRSVSSAQEQSYICLVRALFDYDAVGEDEISFSEGDIIQVTKKDDNGVDDGFWEGQVHGNFGVFPSLVVEEVEGTQPEEAEHVTTTTESQESTYSVPTHITSDTKRPDDYIELPKDYVPGAYNVNNSSSDRQYLQPKRKAPPPPSTLDAMDRRRVQTENLTTMKKPELNSSYQRSVSHEYPAMQTGWNSNINRSANCPPADYVNVYDLPEGNVTNIHSGKPPKPPPPTNRKSKSYV